MTRPFTPDDPTELPCDPCQVGDCWNCWSFGCNHLCESDEYDPDDDEPWPDDVVMVPVETVQPNEAYL